MISNILLIQVNSSNTEFAIQSFVKLVSDQVILAVTAGTIVGILIMLYTPLHEFLKLAPLSWEQMLLAIGIACVAVLWYEVVKFFNQVLRKKI
ncbi:hypothetical protein SOV_33170 [Sporomusa ovata DSM 2662]|nr:P-type ATPase, translocating [Sporomusa ovata DSM 2662]